jgi:hypothetical protein
MQNRSAYAEDQQTPEGASYGKTALPERQPFGGAFGHNINSVRFERTL